jgi:mono/diheme cytochrome c family protein
VTSRREEARGAAAPPARTAPRALVRIALVLLLALHALGATAKPAGGEAPRSLEFLVDSRSVTSLTAGALTQAVAPRPVRVFDPYEQTEVTFTALPLAGVLDQAYGSSWREHEAILFTCRDGYQPTIPVRRVLAQQAFLAFERPENGSRDGFTILKYEEGTRKRIDLAPFYVIWENLVDARTRSEGDYGWPYQVERIDLVSFRSRFGEMTPPEDAPASVLAGFEAFVVHCSKCHPVNGHGGTIGPELNYPANPTEYMKDEWLRRWIDDPAKVRYAPRMPPLNPALPRRARVIDEIVAYLQAMTEHKIAPRTP